MKTTSRCKMVPYYRTSTDDQKLGIDAQAQRPLESPTIAAVRSSRHSRSMSRAGTTNVQNWQRRFGMQGGSALSSLSRSWTDCA